MTSVPPKMGTAPGCAALTSSASRQLSGRKNSTFPYLLRVLLDQIDESEAFLAHPDEPFVRDVQLGQDDEGQQGERHEGVVEPAAGSRERLADRPGALRYFLVGLGGQESGDGEGQQGEILPGGYRHASPLFGDGAGGARHHLLGVAHHHQIVAVMGDGGGQSGGPVEAQAAHEARQVLPRLAVAFYHGDPGDIFLGVEPDKTFLHREFGISSFRLHVVLHDLYGAGAGRPVLFGRANVEGLFGDLASQLDSVECVVRVLEGGQLGHHASLLGHDLAGRDGERDVYVGQVSFEEDDVGAASGGDAADVPPHPEPLGGVEGSHLEGGYGADALLYGVAHHEVHVPLFDEGLGAAVVGDEQDVAGVQAQLGVGFYGGGDVVPGGAAPELGVHPLPETPHRVLGRGALVAAGDAARCVGGEAPVVGRPGEVPVGDLARAQSRIYLTVHLLVAEDHAGEVHHLSEGDHVLPPREGLGDLFGSDHRPGCLHLRRGGRHAGGHLHVSGQGCGTRFIDHEPQATQAEHVGDLVRVEEAAGGAQREDRPRELGDGDLAALDVAVAVEETRRYVASLRLDDPGLVPDRVARVGSHVRNSWALHGDAHVGQDLTRSNAHQRSAADDEGGGQISSGGRGQLPRHLVQRRPSELRHPKSFPREPLPTSPVAEQPEVVDESDAGNRVRQWLRPAGERLGGSPVCASPPFPSFRVTTARCSVLKFTVPPTLASSAWGLAGVQPSLSARTRWATAKAELAAGTPQ